MSAESNRLKLEAFNYKSWQLTERQICDIELLLNGAFAPISGFLTEEDYRSVLKTMRLKDGSLWPIPITLDVTHDFAKEISVGEKITLRDHEGFAIAVLSVRDIYNPDFNEEAQTVYGTTDETHPAVNYLMNHSNPVYLGGTLEEISLPHHYDYTENRHTPAELKTVFKEKGWNKIVAFQTRNPLHRAHVEMTMRASQDLNAKLLIHPVVGMTKPGDVDHYTRVRCYQHVLPKYPKNTAMMSLLPLAMRMGGPREALWHALIRKNFGCTHIVVGRDHAGPGNDKDGNPFYGPYAAQELLMKHQDEIGIEMVPFKFMVYLPQEDKYEAIDTIEKGTDFQTISGTELRELLDQGKGIPEWFTYKEVAQELESSRPPLTERGLTIFFTGLSGSGKSTLANGLLVKLLEDGSRPVTLLDGDIVRTHLSSELGFSKEHRSLNVQRIGFVASEITKNGGIAICAPIAPYTADRRVNRELINPLGGYIEIFVSTSLEKCEERDVKGLYALARKGVLKEFTGISDPYEAPEDAEIVVNSTGISPEVLVEDIFNQIKELGYL
ncbi:MAG: bifunctional sulfate adenylyltransferase/adenylylsulfate kinase [Candidatus Marinimicrobia bacterium]|jgi:sulfate adenylyltransferase|nr:bifunctional sulfate adenylyltransferase/adenylylsulfate kinase [Candidatus Neomarinimicrobiota bacterium]MBT3997068.1 bifunctional sulfate adenylyltransferase/adenylylsulfate kinase [Candidatus Neomarinimicrobiota bacterium]MBT4280095.1 bifunctional sulfate adenylyltransferase/adenylylsulfate kinase [Candidatus Neomarinimicrobiota bacterium]MBT4570521.1 bifunctional sulfate adenylyltransferase/adenylylsulfate kinase [Candidatus Neomarinimicrobiota bacterium]MBT4795779.1 bifunctional sulfate